MVYIMPDKKGDDETLDYIIDFTDRLEDGESLESIIEVQVDSGITQVGEATIVGNGVKVWLQGGTPNTWYHCTAVVQTNNSRVLEDTFKVYVVEHR